MNFFTILLTALGISIVISGYNMLKYIRSAKKEHTLIVFDKIKEWFELIREEKHGKKISVLEKEIDSLFNKKVLKTALLHFSDKFIEQYFAHLNFKCAPDKLQAEFEKLSGTGLKKSRQSLKILSLTYGHNFTLANYSFLNYWYILRGNHRMYDGGKTDSEAKTYTWDDVEGPYRVLEFYFKNK
jgi:hypothetical protein